MSEIMQRNTLDNKNDSIAYSKSLNREARKRELQRITAENQVHKLKKSEVARSDTFPGHFATNPSCTARI